MKLKLAQSNAVLEQYNGNLDWLKRGTGFLTVSGSRSYGTDRPDSDTDVKGVAFPPRKYYTGIIDNFEQAQWAYDETEVVVFGFHKFVKLAADCNPNIIELLYPDLDDVIKADARIVGLFEIRDEFLSTKAKHTFSGYAMSQLKRIKTHRKWLLEPPSSKPEREDFGLKPVPVIPKEQLGAAMAAVQKQLDAWELNLDGLSDAQVKGLTQSLSEQQLSSDERFMAASRFIGLNDNFVEVALQERRYKQSLKNFNQYQTWLSNRNEKRAALEAKYGYDCKHAMHLVRLMRMGMEILKGEGVIVKRPDAEELKAIRDGAWSYDTLIAWAHQMDAAMKAQYQCSPLPKKPNINKINEKVMELTSRSWASYR